MTVNSRPELLEQTLVSLTTAGFESVRVFSDGLPFAGTRFHDELSVHEPKLRAFGNWMLGMWELYIREPDADLYAMFQDDIVACKGLRGYLERCEYPRGSYWNLFTFKFEDEAGRRQQCLPPSPGYRGWYASNQRGRGAVALVFDRDVLLRILTHPAVFKRPQDARRRHRNIDGAVSEAAVALGITEFIHAPSLVQHVGNASTMGHHYPPSDSFAGEGFDAMDLLTT